MVYWLSALAARWYFRWLRQLRVYGRENLPSSGPALLVTNHPSSLDGHLMMAVFRQRVYFLVARQSFAAPVAGWYLTHVGGLPIESGDNAETMAQLGGLFQRRQLVMILPEGGVNPDPVLRPFRPGFLRIAGRFGVPIIPVAIAGVRDEPSGRPLAIARHVLRRTPVAVSVLPPRHVADLHADRAGFDAAVREVHDVIAAQVARLTRLQSFSDRDSA